MGALDETDRPRNLTPPALPPEPALSLERLVQQVLLEHVGKFGLESIDHATRVRLAIGLAEEADRQLAARRS